MRSTDDDIIHVEEGWIAAVNDTDEQRRLELERVVKAYESGWQDLYGLGYMTYCYGYTRVRLTKEHPRVEQLPLFAEVTP